MDGYLQDFSICDHQGAAACHIKVALVELPEAPSGCLGLIPAIYLGYVVALYVGDAIQGYISGKGHRQVIPQAQQLPTCIGKLRIVRTIWL